MCLLDEVFGKVEGVAICLKCTFVFIQCHYEAPARLPHIRLIAVGACQFVYPGCVYLSNTCFFALVTSG